MKLDVIGTGPIGTSLARTFSAGGHDAEVANSRGPERWKTAGWRACGRPSDSGGPR
ncbi:MULTISPECIES: NAD(P)-binding domain-containing protein [unclassified Streptomyces]|uniref:NAD(P)-binding domain-containing protein n=1 Tax=unclassified Streptomyces TaxID=2593676 RepID=UPI0033E9D6A0